MLMNDRILLSSFSDDLRSILLFNLTAFFGQAPLYLTKANFNILYITYKMIIQLIKKCTTKLIHTNIKDKLIHNILDR